MPFALVMSHQSFALALLILAVIGTGCATQAPVSTPTPAPTVESGTQATMEAIQTSPPTPIPPALAPKPSPTATPTPRANFSMVKLVSADVTFPNRWPVQPTSLYAQMLRLWHMSVKASNRRHTMSLATRKPLVTTIVDVAKYALGGLTP